MPAPAPTGEPSLRRSHPPQRLIDAVNPLARRLPGSRLHRLSDGSLLVLHVTGRRTGRTYDVPVGFLTLDGQLVVVTEHRWRVNLRGGAEVEVTHGGARRAMRAALVEDPDAVATVYERLVAAYGWATARRRLGLAGSDGPPSHAELVALAGAADLAVVELTPPAG